METMDVRLSGWDEHAPEIGADEAVPAVGVEEPPARHEVPDDEAGEEDAEREIFDVIP